MRKPSPRVASLIFALAICQVMVACQLLAQTNQTQPAKQGPVDEKTIIALIAQLGAGEFEKREAADNRLAEIGEPALALLQKAAKAHSDPEVRFRAQQLTKAINRSYFVQVRRFEKTNDKNVGQWANRVAVTRDGRFAIAGAYGTLRCWEIATGKENTFFDWPPNSSYTWSVTVTRDERFVLTGSTDRIARMMDLKTGKLVKQFVGHESNIWGMLLLPNGKEVISGASDKSIRVWDLQTGKQIRAFEDVVDHPRCMAISPDGKLLAVGHYVIEPEPGTLRIWDLATGKQLRAIKGHTLPITSVAFSADGNTIMTSGFDKVLRLWETATGKELKVFRGHTSRVEYAAFTPDGKRIVSCGDQDDMTLRLWDVATGSEILQSAETVGGFTSVAVLPDNRHCVTTGKDGYVRLWEWKK